MQARSRCLHTPLARSPIGSVDRCACGMIHLNLGALTLRLEPAAVEELQRMLDEAMTENARRAAPAAPDLDALWAARRDPGGEPS